MAQLRTLLGVMLFFAFGILDTRAIDDSSVGRRQSLPPASRQLNDCPRYLSEAQWDYYQQTFCPFGPKFHCIEHRDNHGVLKIISACVDPLTCDAGSYAFLNESIINNVTYVKLLCLPCEGDFFEPHPTLSYEFKWSVCSRERQKCPAAHGKILTKEGNTKEDNLCRCLWENGYVPSRRLPECLSPGGFVYDSPCHCVHHSCELGYTPDREYNCAPMLSTTSTTPTTTPPAATTGKPHGRPSKSHKTRAMESVVLIVISAFVFAIGLPSVCHLLHI